VALEDAVHDEVGDGELIESRTLDGRIQELIYRPTLHT
jgi:hypothetical protein